jgi:phage tail sheath protein FI
MAYTRPDVYIEEILTPELAPQGVSTSIASFVGATLRGPSDKAIFVDSFDAFKRIFGDTAVDGEPIFYSVRSFFENGGAGCYIVRAVSASQVGGATPIASPANTTLDNEASTGFLKFSAGYRGSDSFGASGKDISVKVSEIGVTTDTAFAFAQGDTSLQIDSASGISEGDIVVVSGTVNSAPNTEYLKVSSIESNVTSSGTINHTLNFTSAVDFGGSYSLPAGGSVKVMAYDLEVLVDAEQVEAYDRLSVDPESDLYFETILNDEQVGSEYIKVEDLQASSSILSNNKEILSTSLGNGLFLNSDGQDELTNFAIGTDLQNALDTLDAKDAVNLLCVPTSLASTGIFPASKSQQVHILMLNYVKNRMDMFAILDAPSGKTAGASGSGSIGDFVKNDLGLDSYWGGLYYPHIKVPQTLGKPTPITIPPSGAIAGLYSRVDAIGAPTGGVSSAPAGFGDFGRIESISGLEVEVSEAQHGALNAMGVNCLRIVDRGRGGVSINVLGARTLSSGLDFRYINVRRMMNFIEKRVKGIGEQSLFRNNGPVLWASLTSQIESFLTKRFEAGELAGNTLDQAFYVKIDSTNNTADNIKQGILVGEIGVALLRPAEFIVFKFSQVQAG